MQQHKTFYPVRIVSRSAAKKRFRRVSWFVLGTSFGIGCAFALLPLLPVSSLQSAKNDDFSAEMEIAAAIDETPLAKGIDIIAFAPPSSRAAPASPEHKARAYKDEKPAIYPLTMALKVENGDTLMNILTDTGTSYDEAQNAIESIKKIYNPKRLDVGQTIAVVLDKGESDVPVISSIRIPTSSTSTVEANRKKSGNREFAVKEIVESVERRLAHVGGRIDSSLYETGISNGIPAGLINDIINAYSYDVDFQRDIQPGDAMDVLFERMETKDGVTAGHGNILYAELNLSGKPMKIYRYTDKSGIVDYYNERGESVRKALLRTPINGAKITSAFGMRNHPILGYSKMHRGVDFGAATGTPIYAAGDGTVDFAGRKGGYGNYLRIKHNDKYASAYGHISRFAVAITPGRKVRQGQIIAYVGATGMATGPHLHYEILVNNEQVNPSGVKFRAGNVLAGKEMASFKRNMEQIQAQRNTTPRKTDMAANHSKAPKELVVAANSGN